MGGITGFLGGVGPEEAPVRLAAMAEAIRHRGAAGAGWVGAAAVEAVGLAERFRGNSGSVCASEDDRVRLVADAALTNVGELRAELEGRGHRFATPGPHEVILHAYEEWGDGCAQHLWGDFAFALLDARRGRLVCGRDRVGVRPLYYAIARGGFVFASEIKGLLQHPAVKAVPDWETVFFYAGTHYRYIDRDQTGSFYAGIRQVPPAHLVIWEGGQARSRRYWDLDPAAAWDAADMVGARRRLQELLEDGVRRRLPVDGARAGFTVSSGMDSSSVASLAAHLGGRRVDLYSTTVDDPEYDETPHLAPLVDRWGTGLRRVPVSGADLVKGLPALVAQHDEPVCTATWFAHRLLAEAAAREGVEVLFGGLGGDECMAGEYEHFFFYFADLRARGDEARLAREVAAWQRHHDHPAFRKNPEVLARAFTAWIDWDRPGVNRLDEVRFGAYQGALAPDFRARHARRPAMTHPFRSYLANRCYQDLSSETTPPCLRAQDRNAAAHGMEVQLPFLDHRIIELAFALPGDFKYRDGVTKQILRDAMEGLLPAATRARVEKTGWNAPAHRWFREEAREPLADLIASRTFRERGVYDVAAVERVFREHTEGRANHAMFLWQVWNLETWSQIRLGGRP